MHWAHCTHTHVMCEGVHVMWCYISLTCWLSRHWSVDSGEVDLVSGQVHTNQVSCIVATPEKLYTLGLDKSFKTIQAATNEFEWVWFALSLSLSLSLSFFLSNNNYGKLGGKLFLFSVGTIIINWRMCNNYQEAYTCILSQSYAFKSYTTASSLWWWWTIVWSMLD